MIIILSDNMDKKEMMVGGIIVVVAIVVASIVFAPTTDAQTSNLSILNKGEVGENGTVYVKLTDNQNTSLSGKTVHIKISDSHGKAVYQEDATTHATGVAMVKLNNMSPGTYTVEVVFDGDENYTSSSVSKKITISGNVTEEVVEDADLVEQTIEESGDSQDTSNSQSYTPSSSYSHSSSSSQSSSHSSSHSSSSSSDEELINYDENGRETLPEYDEDGNEV